MISERQLANGFSAFWHELAPLLTPDFVRLFNVQYGVRLSDELGYPMVDLPIGKDVVDPAIVAETAFELAKFVFGQKIDLGTVLSTKDYGIAAFERASAHVGQFKKGRVSDGHQDLESALVESTRLLQRYLQFFATFNHKTTVTFSPAFSGAGFLSACFGDIAFENAIIEVKTITRHITGTDLRQLIIYLALDWAESGIARTHAAFFNPRRAMVYQFEVLPLLMKISGGHPPTTVFRSLIEYVSLRETEIDAVF